MFSVNDYHALNLRLNKAIASDQGGRTLFAFYLAIQTQDPTLETSQYNALHAELAENEDLYASIKTSKASKQNLYANSADYEAYMRLQQTLFGATESTKSNINLSLSLYKHLYPMPLANEPKYSGQEQISEDVFSNMAYHAKLAYKNRNEFNLNSMKSNEHQSFQEDIDAGAVCAEHNSLFDDIKTSKSLSEKL